MLSDEEGRWVWRVVIALMVLVFGLSFLMLGMAWLTKTRAGEVRECMKLVQLTAPLDVTQADPDYAFYAALRWCNDFVETGGREKEP